MSKSSHRLLLAGRARLAVASVWFMVAALSGVQAQTLDAVTPGEGAWGTGLTITGADLQGAGKKPRVFLTSEGSKKKLKLKVLSASPGAVVAQLRKGPAGTYDLHVRPKGKAFTEVVASDAVSIRAPTEIDLLDASGKPGHDLELTGRFFGSRKGKVFVGGKKAVVIAWESGGAGPGDGAPLDRIRYRVPMSAFDGQHAVEVVSRAGTGVAGEPLLVEDSKAKIKGKPGFMALIDGTLLEGKQIGHAIGPDEVRLTASAEPAAPGEAPAELRLRLVYATAAGFTTTLEQQFLEAFVAYDRPVAGTDEVETFVSTSAVVQVELVGKVLKGTFTTTLQSETSEELLELAAGVFASKPMETLPVLSPPVVAFFSVSDTEVDLGDPVTFSWEITGADPQLTSCLLELKEEDFLPEVVLDCAAKGEFVHVFNEGDWYYPRLRVFHQGEQVFSQQLTVRVLGMDVRIITPTSTNPVDGDMDVRVEVKQATFAFDVVAQVAGLEVPLAVDGEVFTGTVPLAGTPQDEYDVVVEAEDANGVTARELVHVIWDEAPVIEVTSPVFGAVGTPMLPASISATDSSGESTTIAVSVWASGLGNYTEVATGQDVLDGPIELSPYDGRVLSMKIRATDQVGLYEEVETTVIVESSTLITAIDTSPGLILDADADGGRRLLGLGGTAGLVVEDTLPGTLTPVPRPGPPEFAAHSVPTIDYDLAHLTPTGVIFSARDASNDDVLFDWRDGELVKLTGPDGATTLHFGGVLDVQGDVAAFQTQGADPLWRLRFSTGELVEVAEGSDGFDLAPDGTVVFGANYKEPEDGDLVSIDLAGTRTQLTFDPSIEDRDPLTDGTLWVYTKDGGPSGEAIALLVGGLEELLRPYTTGANGDVDVRKDYRVAGGWVAFTRVGTLGQREVWVRADDGTITKVSPDFAADSEVEAVSPDGQVMFRHDGRRYHWRAGVLQDVSASHGAFSIYEELSWTDAGLRLFLGDTVFSLP